MANKNFKVKNSITIPEPLALTEGGTGQTSATNALNALLPVQSSANTKFLQSDGTNVSWVANVAYQRGGTESRPASPTVGDLYYNTDYNYFESYTSNGWFPIAAAPGTPTEVTATNTPTSRAYNNGRMTVAFTAPTSGGAPTSFIVTPTPTTSPSTFTGSSSPVTVTGLASSTQYTYTVAATSPYGTSAASSASSGVTATTVPQAPSISAPSASETTATITITPGATGGSAITEYAIISSPTTTTQTTSSSPYTFTGLTTGTAYTFTATATNANGISAASAASNSITPAVQGSFESIQTITGNTSNTVTFTSIPQTFTHLQLRVTARCALGGYNFSGYTFRLGSSNSIDSGNNYSYHRFYTSGNNSFGTDGAANYGTLGDVFFTANDAIANNFAVTIVDIWDYTNTSKYKTTKHSTAYDNNATGGSSWANNSVAGISYGSGNWRSFNAVNTLQLIVGGSATNNTNNVYALYGIKGA